MPGKNKVREISTKEQTIFLASGSPQRKAILQELGIAFEVLSMDVDEVTLNTPEATVLENARIKALATLPIVPDESIVIAADTVLFAQGNILGKPADRKTARTYLSMLSGQSVRAYSGVAVIRKGDPEGALILESAQAHIRSLSEPEIVWYVETEEPLTRAGAFGVSRYGELFVERIEGSYSCIAGLPKAALLAGLSQISPPFPAGPPAKFLATQVQMETFQVPD
jgi:septum formation protein